MLESVGANAAVLAARRNSLAVLCYHRVLDAGDPARTRTHPALITSTRAFEEQMRIITDLFEPVTLTEALRWLDGHCGIPRRAVLLTFDDGWSDNYTNALPIMDRLGVPGVVFLATGLIGTNERQWADAAYESMAAHAGLDAASRELDRLKHMSSRLARSALDCGVTRRLAQPPNLDWPQVREMAAHGFEFGSHTRSHIILPCESNDDVLDELRASAEDIEMRIGCAPTAFAYPDGQYDRRATRLVEQSGHRCALTIDEGLVTRKSARFALPRLSIHDGVCTTPSGEFSRAMFLTYLAGTIPWRYRRRVR